MARKILSAAAVGFVLTGCWAGFRNDPARTGQQPFEFILSPTNVAELERVWAAPTGGAVSSSPAMVSGVVYVGSDDGQVRAFDAAGVTNCTGVPSTCTPLWNRTTGGAITSSPAVANGVVYIGSADTSLYAFGLPGTAPPTTTTVSSNANPATAGTPITFTATVTSPIGVPTGTVTFTDGQTTLANQTLANGQATVTVSNLTVGTHTIGAGYSGGGPFPASSASPISQVVNATGTLRYVDRASSACTDSGNGTVTAPFCTINGAALKATAGQTVIVAAGTYAEQVTVVSSGTATAPIIFTAASGATVNVSGARNGFTITGRSWIVVRGFDVTTTTSHGISVIGSSNIVIESNRVSRAGLPEAGRTGYGIHLSGVTQSFVSDNTTDRNTDAGIHVVAASNSNVVTGNVSFSNARGYVRAAAGIDVRESTGNLVHANVAHDNEDSGINAWTGLTNGQNTFSNNISQRNGDHGIDVHNAVDARVIANTVFRNADSGIESTTSTRTYIANNVSVDNGINSTRSGGNLRIDSSSAGTATLNDDLVFMSVPGTVVDWSGTKYTTLAAFRSATGQESRGLEGDPRFRSAAAADFRLLAGSPAIDSANADASGQPATDFNGLGRFDDPATANTGIGVIRFVDRGAFEYRP